MLSVIGVAAVTLIAVIFIKQYRPEFAVILSLAGGLIIVLLCLTDLRSVFSSLNGYLADFSVDGKILTVVLKVLGVCLITDFASNICKDFGNSTLASGVEFTGKIVVVGISLPIIGEILRVAVELIK